MIKETTYMVGLVYKVYFIRAFLKNCVDLICMHTSIFWSSWWMWTWTEWSSVLSTAEQSRAHDSRYYCNILHAIHMMTWFHSIIQWSSVIKHLILCPFVYFNSFFFVLHSNGWIGIDGLRWMCENAIFWNNKSNEAKMSYKKMNKENKNFVLTRNEI